MKLFCCQVCQGAIYFENRFCGSCGHALGYVPNARDLAALEPEGDAWIGLHADSPRLRYCKNAGPDACNWMIPDDQQNPYCIACQHNRTIPDLSIGDHLMQWQLVEIAKHRLFYTLLALHLPLTTRTENPAHGLAFDFLSEDPNNPGEKVLTKHDDGVIVINLDEADDVKRATLRSAMHEPYRTLLGHFRHEVGHYFWDVLVRDADRIDECRALFGDESVDYNVALKNYYELGAPEGWRNDFISAYATSHPWEDFAETWAHYLHIVDTMETACAFGLRIHPTVIEDQALHADLDFDPHQIATVEQLISAWLPLTFAFNNINRSMGESDLYPFILSDTVIRKLQFVHAIIKEEQEPVSV
jgi:hypothetical protein